MSATQEETPLRIPRGSIQQFAIASIRKSYLGLGECEIFEEGHLWLIKQGKPTRILPSNWTIV